MDKADAYWTLWTPFSQLIRCPPKRVKSKPLHRLGVVLAVGVHDAEVVLGAGVPLLGGLAVPLDRLGIVLCNAQALGIHGTEVGLGLGYALLGCFAVPPHRFGVVLRDT